METWTKEDNALAMREGWNVWLSDDGMQIQRLDWPRDHDIDADPSFESDAEAVAHVVKRAREGSETHAKALRIASADTLVVAALAAGGI